MRQIKIHSKYQSLRQSSSRYHIITGGRASGKSYAICLNLLLLTYEKGHTILFTRYTMTSARISIIPEFKSKVDMLELNNDFHITDSEIVNKITGSKILFRGIKASSGLQTANLKSIEGVTTWVLDEAEELHDQDIFDVIDESVRTLTNQNRVILIMNPTTRSHWIYKHFFIGQGVNGGECTQVGDTNFIHTTYLDNQENLAESWLKKANLLKERRPEEYKNRFLGAWLNKAKGVVFTNWELGSFKRLSAHAFGQDYGFSKDATTLVEVSIDFDNMKMYLKQHMYAHGLKTDAIYKLNKQAAGDDIIIADLAEGRLIEELEDKGLNIERCKKGAGSIVYGINLMKQFDLIVDPSSTELIEELNNYAWLGKKDGVPMDDYNHILDAARYAATYLNNDRDKGVYHIM
jgi:phage terminase large subunit